MAPFIARPLPRPHCSSRIRQHDDRDALGGAGVEEVRVGGREWGVEAVAVAAVVVLRAEQAGAGSVAAELTSPSSLGHHLCGPRPQSSPPSGALRCPALAGILFVCHSPAEIERVAS